MTKQKGRSYSSRSLAQLCPHCQQPLPSNIKRKLHKQRNFDRFQAGVFVVSLLLVLIIFYAWGKV